MEKKSEVVKFFQVHFKPRITWLCLFYIQVLIASLLFPHQRPGKFFFKSISFFTNILFIIGSLRQPDSTQELGWWQSPNDATCHLGSESGMFLLLYFFQVILIYIHYRLSTTTHDSSIRTTGQWTVGWCRPIHERWDNERWDVRAQTTSIVLLFEPTVNTYQLLRCVASPSIRKLN